MFKLSRPCRGVSASARLAVIVAIAVACFVANGQAHAETQEPAQMRAVQETESSSALDPVAVDFRSEHLSVAVVGTGPDLILIPGLGSSRDVWIDLVERLKTKRRIHLVHYAGFAGERSAPEGADFISPRVEALAAYIRHAKLDRPAVIGHSMGGLSGLLLAQAALDQVGRLMVVDALPFYSAMFGPGVSVESARPFADRAAAMIMDADAAGFEAQQFQTAKLLSRTPSEQSRILTWSLSSDRRALASAMRDVMLTDARPGLATMKTPVTALYASDEEGGAPAAVADALWAREYAALADARLIRVDESRHFIMADQPERFARLVEDFLAD